MLSLVCFCGFLGFLNLLLWSGALVVLICLLLIDSQLCINQE